MHTFSQNQSQPESGLAGFARPKQSTLPHPQNRHVLSEFQRSVVNQTVLRIPKSQTGELDAKATAKENRGFGHDFSRIPLYSPTTGVIQRKLAVNRPGDEYEREADCVSELVMRMAEPNPEGGLSLKRLAGNNVTPTEAPSIVNEVLGSPGQPLDTQARLFMEPRFGHDFSQIRVHADTKAASSAQAMNASAYTSGRDVVFDAGRYAPATGGGQRLIAHELAHVVQQGAAGPAGVLQRQTATPSAAPAAAPPQLTQQLYDQACASLGSRAGVNPALVTILKQGKVGQTIRGVRSAASTMQVSTPSAPGSDAGAPSAAAPAVKISFDLQVSPDTSQLPSGAFADFVNDPKNQTSFDGQVATGQTITRLLKIITKAPTGTNAAETLGEALVHEGTHMLLAIDELLGQVNIPGMSAASTGAQTAFSKYTQAAAGSTLRGALIASLVAEVFRVFTPTGASSPGISAADANSAVGEALNHLLEERFAVDQQLSAYPRTVSNLTLAGAYLWDVLGDETSKKPWPVGPNAQKLIASVAAFLDDVAAKLHPPPGIPGTASPNPAPTQSSAPQKQP